MKMKITVLLISILPFISFSQKSIFSEFGVNYSNQKELFWIKGVSIYNQFGLNLKDRISATAELKFSYAGADDNGIRNYPSNVIDQKRDYAFGAYPGENLDNGIIRFEKTYLAKYLAFNLDLGMNFNLIKREKHDILFGFGISLAYIDKQYTGSSIDGEFFSVFYGDQSITIISPFYIRYLDIGYNIKLNYVYKLNKKVHIGLRGDMVNLKVSHYSIFGIGPFLKLNI